jgi:hypothetical protein
MVIYRVTTASGVITLIEDLRGAAIIPLSSEEAFVGGGGRAIQALDPDYFWKMWGTPPFTGTSAEVIDHGKQKGLSELDLNTVGGTPGYGQAGPFAEATSLDESIDYVAASVEYNSFGDEGLLRTSNTFGSFTAWVRPATNHTGTIQAMLAGTAGGAEKGVWYGVETGTTGPTPALNVRIDDTPEASANYVTDTELPLNAWSFIVWTKTASDNPILYIDGVADTGTLTASFVGTGAVTDWYDDTEAGTYTTALGCKVGAASTDEPFNGRLSNISYFREKILTADEISDIYEKAKPIA